MGDTQENWVMSKNGPSHCFKYHLQLNTKENVESQQDPLWPTSQNIRNKRKNKQMGPNET